MDYIPNRGDIIWLNFDPHVGHEQAGRRPAFVLSPADYNGKVNLAIVCPITSRIKGYPFEVVIPENLPIRGAIPSDQIKSLDWKFREAELVCTPPIEILNLVIQKINLLLKL